jgi:hypothetical protein
MKSKELNKYQALKTPLKEDVIYLKCIKKNTYSKVVKVFNLNEYTWTTVENWTGEMSLHPEKNRHRGNYTISNFISVSKEEFLNKKKIIKILPLYIL